MNPKSTAESNHLFVTKRTPRHLRNGEPKLKSEIIESLKAPQMQVATVTLVYQIVKGCLRQIGAWIKTNWENGDRIHREVEARKEEAIRSRMKNGIGPRNF